MSWGLICAMAALVFFNRYLFLEPRIQVRMPHFIQRMLHYAAPCLLSAICFPVIFFDDSQQFKGLWLNPYFYAALAAVILYLYSKRILISSIGSFMVFYLLQYLLN
ncbi:AzlD domain-containing protein [Acinetobacter pullicarnis]|uniref:AzlD domain-containing protein n=1 Tax=Acinetobacter pullicarnis TaxID=2576829 RepID=UPI00111CF78B|nr:AzlD domain-containing protein [Acinetobacter pullicarnis]